LKNKVFHEAANIYDACQVDITHRGEFLVDTCSRLQGPHADTDSADALHAPQTGIKGHNDCITELAPDFLHCGGKVCCVNRGFQAAKDMSARKAEFLQSCSNDGTQRVTSGAVGANTDEDEGAPLI